MICHLFLLYGLHSKNTDVAQFQDDAAGADALILDKWFLAVLASA